MTINLEDLTELDVATQTARLRTLYRPPAGVPAEGILKEFWESFKRGHISANELLRACDMWIDGPNEFWPTPGKLLECVHALRRLDGPKALTGWQGRYQTWMKRGCPGPCPVCGAEWDGVISGAEHVHEVHVARGVGYSPPRRKRKGVASA